MIIQEECSCDICSESCHICGKKARIVFEAKTPNGVIFKKYVCNDCEFGGLE